MNRQWRLVVNKFLRNPMSLISGGVLLLLVFMALAADWVAPYSPLELHNDALTVTPFTRGEFVLGTDDVGRDVLSRLIHGARLSLGLGLLSVFLAVMVGVPIGLVAGFYGGRWDRWIMRATDILLTLPSILLAIVFVAVMGPGLFNTVVAISVVALPQLIRVVRSVVMVEREKLYVQAAQSFGAADSRLILKHIFPNVVSAVIVQATLGFSDAILNAAALGFLGLGAQPPTAEWGVMLADARPYIESAWWLVALPGICILISSLSFNLLGDGLRDALDPKVR